MHLGEKRAAAESFHIWKKKEEKRTINILPDLGE